MFIFFGLLVIVGAASAQYLSHGGPLLSHGGPLLSHGGPLLSHGGPLLSHGGPLLSHGGPLIHAAPALIAKPVLKYAAPLVKTVEIEAPAHYDFSYSVHDDHTGDIKSQTESRKGDVVQGQYTLVDADGFLRTVDYTSDAHNGFNAIVRRDPLGHKVVKAIAPIAKVLTPVAHYATPKLLAAPLIPKLAVAHPGVAHVSVHSPAYAYSH